MDNCRLCGSEQFIEALYSLQNEDLQIEYKLEKCFNLKLSEIKLLSQMICVQCISNLENAHDFYEIIVSTQKNLLDSLDQQIIHLEDAVIVEDMDDTEIKLEMLMEVEETIEQELDEPSTSIKVKEKRRSNTKVKERIKSIRIHNENTSLKMEDIFVNEFSGVYSEMPDTLELEKHEKNDDGTLTKNAIQKVKNLGWNKYEWKCYLCSTNDTRIIFKSRSNMEDHFRASHPDVKKSYSCGDCKLAFKSYYSFQNHVIDHRPLLKFSCDTCSKFYWNLIDLHNHRIVCNPRMKHTCLYCGKIYESGFFLKNHVGNHQKYKPEELFYCDLCNFSTHTKFLVKQHLITTHIGNEKELVCELCGKICKRSSDMRSHRLVHTNLR